MMHLSPLMRSHFHLASRFDLDAFISSSVDSAPEVDTYLTLTLSEAAGAFCI